MLRLLAILIALLPSGIAAEDTFTDQVVALEQDIKQDGEVCLNALQMNKMKSPSLNALQMNKTNPDDYPDCSYGECYYRVLQLGLKMGGSGYSFKGDYSYTGCYAYGDGPWAGTAFYGTVDDGTDVKCYDELTTPQWPAYRLVGTDHCFFCNDPLGPVCGNFYSSPDVLHGSNPTNAICYPPARCVSTADRGVQCLLRD